MRGRAPGFRQVLGVKEFRSLWAAELFSIVGDQLAGVALAVLVYQRTSSAALTALTYALSFVPSVLGGMLLSGLADRFPRRSVLVSTDLVRATLAAVMALPGLSLPALWALVALLSMSAAPFKAAQLALLPQVLDEESYLVGLSLRQITNQSAQLAGFASAGLLLVVVEPHVALLANAATFVVSAVLILVGVRRRPAAAARAAQRGGPALPRTARRRLAPLVMLICLTGLFVVPEGIAAPYGSALGAGSIGIGLLMAADPLGSVIGAWLLTRTGMRPNPVPIVVLAVGAGVPLLLCAPEPNLVISIMLWAASGAMSTAYLILIQGAIVELVPDERRGRVLGRIATGLYASQGIAIVIGGIAAEELGPYRAVAGAGLLGIVLALCVGLWWRRVARSRCDLVTGSEHDRAESQSHVLVRHPKHLLRNTEEQGFEHTSHVLVRHRAHLLRNSRERDSQRVSHVLVRHRKHLPCGLDQQFEMKQHGSHVLVRHPSHLPLGRSQQPEQGKDTSHVLVRHRKHLLSVLANRRVNQAPENDPTRHVPQGTQASSLWASIAGTLLGRNSVGRMA
ncbi:MAG TPA: MFS transporter [Actinophytocola sp.]|uniref:MFS transporter n=1 Tax=Actinophytocola sp. TaxID=1872138 RepID=UPI002DBFB7F8|nr:MFS transporter [Actinophytocola sp.]HEU5474879.1 MFS transporter [Actinophytocola sp.]